MDWSTPPHKKKLDGSITGVALFRDAKNKHTYFYKFSGRQFLQVKGWFEVGVG